MLDNWLWMQIILFLFPVVVAIFHAAQIRWEIFHFNYSWKLWVFAVLRGLLLVTTACLPLLLFRLILDYDAKFEREVVNAPEYAEVNWRSYRSYSSAVVMVDGVLCDVELMRAENKAEEEITLLVGNTPRCYYALEDLNSRLINSDL